MLPYFLLSLVCVLIVTAHVLSAVCGARLLAVSITVGLCLHVPLLLLLIYVGASMEVAVLVFLASIALYTACAAWRSDASTVPTVKPPRRP